MLKSFWILVTGLLFAFEVSAATRDFAMRKCNEELRQNAPEIEVVYNFGDLGFDNTKTADELSEMIEKTYPQIPNHKLNGLTQLMPYVSIESRANRTVIDNYACYYPQHLRVVIGYKPTVYIRNDIAPGSCRFNVTLRHEQTHLDIGHLSLVKFAQLVKDIFPQQVNDIGVRIEVYRDDIRDAQVSSEMNNTYITQMNVFFEKFVKEMTEQQMLIDTRESYKAETALCPKD